MLTPHLHSDIERASYTFLQENDLSPKVWLCPQFNGLDSVVSILASRARAQVELFRQAVLEVTVEAKQEPSDLSTNGRLLVSAVAKIANKGTRNTFLDFREQTPFRVYRVDFDSAGVGVRIPVLDLDVGTSYMTLRTGATGEFPVFFAVTVPGLYGIDFWVQLSADELKVHEATARDDAGQRSTKVGWKGHTHLVVR